MYEAYFQIIFGEGTDREREFTEQFEHECSVPVGDWVQNKIGETITTWSGNWNISHGSIGHIEQSAYRTIGTNREENISFEILSQ